MKKTEFRSLPNFSQQKHVNVDRESDTISNIEIAKYGRNKNSSFFDDKFLNDLAAKGNEQPQGVKSRFGHPNMCASSLGTYVGRYNNFRVKNQKVYADLSLDPISKKTEVEGKGIKMYEYVMDMAESNSDMFGNSIVIMGDDYQGEIEYEDGEKKMETVKVLHSLLASDLVDDPAATDALFSVKEDFGMAMTDFLDTNPQIFETVNQNPSIVMDFLDRYENYHNRKLKKGKMNLLNKMKEKFGASKVEPENFDIDLTLATGDMITVVTENETAQVGDMVQDADGKAVEDKDHLLQDGRKVVTEGGKITEIKEADAGEEEEEEEDNSNAEFSAKFDKFSKEVNESLGLILEQFGKHDEAISKLQKTVKSKKFEAPNKIDRKRITQEGEDSFEAKVEAQREARKKKK